MADLSKLREIPAARARLDREELELIDRARRAGATWGEIAGALGLRSRQAAEQRRLRLATAVPPAVPDSYGLSALREAALELHRRVGADRRWDRRFTRAVLVRETLSAVPGAAGGALFALAEAVLTDLADVAAPLPAPTRAAVGRLRAALEAASPRR
ncbi:hypothetical protein [Paractinoplanes brasiliensis]|uniref:Homeodomain-like domain-containing protein n=1 Tax=Paractinoplanes brasiliensis TaxID=52695 RepID=A0A4R6JPK4_9ACTN|nr:hypothetical protein [Actinoplanes brasiliensis]TDO37742.1 hypothetical protein C8E87_1376 [Actinoplanes brasiliensis]GID32082.1 hypothetical protein Abr02nite_70650 [Actinoplanes brasiliensis]